MNKNAGIGFSSPTNGAGFAVPPGSHRAETSRVLARSVPLLFSSRDSRARVTASTDPEFDRLRKRFPERPQAGFSRHPCGRAVIGENSLVNPAERRLRSAFD